MALGGSNFKLRSSTHNDPYAELEYTTPAAVTAGQVKAVGDVVGVVVNSGLISTTAVLVYQAAKILVPCQLVTTGNLAAYAVGSKVYHDVADNNVNTVASGNTLCGIVLVAPTAGDETVLIHLMGALGIVS